LFGGKNKVEKGKFLYPKPLKNYLLKIKTNETLLSFFLIIVSLSKSDAQSISMGAISSGGDSYSSPTSRLSFTTGQVMSGTYKNASNT
jgi:hypothetical protein